MAVNSGDIDGMTSGLLSQTDFESSYCYYYARLDRMLEDQLDLTKSYDIVGINSSLKAVDYYCFIAFKTSIKLNILTGARVL
jgi:hypothetical protein